MSTLQEQLILEEGMKLSPYKDKLGFLSIGVGRCLDTNPLTDEELSRIGHDCRSSSITQEQAIYLLNNDINSTRNTLTHTIPWWSDLDEIRARVIIDLAFNMGVAGLLKFVHMLEALRSGLWMRAANELSDSMWASQVQHSRRDRLVNMLATGQDYDY
jgi:lysozyme